jgi:hypothetical protein
MKVLVLAAAEPDTRQGQDSGYPALLSQVGAGLQVERLVSQIESLGADPVFVLREQDARKFHLTDVIRQLAPCTALLAAQHIAPEEELLVLNANEILDVDFLTVIEGFRAQGFDAGLVCFPSVHPRYSYVRLSDEKLVTEAAEKRPISRNATAGFYWFRKGADFILAAQGMIRKDAHVDGVFYICPAFNELVLRQRRIGIHAIEARHYIPLKSAAQLDTHETAATLWKERA